MKILVTGDLGTVGHVLVKELRGRGHDVWVCNLFPLPRPPINEPRISRINTKTCVEPVETKEDKLVKFV